MDLKNNKSDCCIPNCLSTIADLTFKFPANELEGMAWLKVIRSDMLDSMTYADIKKQRRGVCFKHFPVDAVLILSNGRKTLKKGFMPNLNLAYPSALDSSMNSKIVEKPSKNKKLDLKSIEIFFLFHRVNS